MTSFDHLTAVAAPLPLENVDTDKIVAGRFLKTITRAGLGQALFSTLREDPAFVLNRAPWNQAGILIALDNFGCGSSREHAPWALLDFGFRCVIAPGIADIFYNNCFKNGILPVVLPLPDVQHLLALASDAATAAMTIDLPTQTITTALGEVISFPIDARRKHDLLQGIDEIARTMSYHSAISATERRRAAAQPWLRDVSLLVLPA
jgi:3-isopropylmalate/(R)-2-methylmalate dehydratase small subunit